jgi:hypothetical protein
MPGKREVIDIDLEDGERGQVVINAEAGSVVTVNINVKHYGYPEWFDRSALDAIVAAIKGRE